MTQSIVFAYVALVAVAFAVWTTLAALSRDRHDDLQGDGSHRDGARTEGSRRTTGAASKNGPAIAPRVQVRDGVPRAPRQRPAWFDGERSPPLERSVVDTGDTVVDRSTAREPAPLDTKRRPTVPVVRKRTAAPMARSATPDPSTPDPATARPSTPGASTPGPRRDPFDAFDDASSKDRF